MAMFAQHQGGAVASAAKRQHTARGATKEKTRKLDELKAKRKEKDDRSKVCSYLLCLHRNFSLTTSPPEQGVRQGTLTVAFAVSLGRIRHGDGFRGRTV